MRKMCRRTEVRFCDRRLSRPAFTLLLLSMACGLALNDADQHREDAEQYLKDGRGQEALIEFYQATRLKPDDLELNLRAGEVFAEMGHHTEAADFYRDALSASPDDSEILLRLGDILVYIDPLGAEAMADELLEANPKNAQGWLLKAKLALQRNETDSVKTLVEKARRIAPHEAEADWILALVEEAIDRNAQLKNPLARVSPNQQGRVAQSYQRYLTKNGRRKLKAQLGQAKALTLMGGQSGEQGLLIYQGILEQPLKDYSQSEKVAAFNEILTFSLRTQDSGLVQKTLDRWIQTAPEDLRAWTYQAQLYEGAPESIRDEAFGKIRDQADGNLAMQVVYAEHLILKMGLENGLGFLEDQLTGDPSDAELLAQILELQHRHMRLRDAEKSLATYRKRFPERVALQHLSARHALLKQDYASAVGLINEMPRHQRGPLDYQIAANALMKQGLDKKALEQVKLAMALAPEADPPTLKLKAQIEFNLREYRRAAATLIKLGKMTPLGVNEEIMLARSYYESRAPGVGRKVLTGVLDRDPGQSAIALELYRQEGDGSNRPEIVEQALTQALAVNSSDFKVLEALTEIDLRAGNPDRAMTRVNEIIEPSNWLGPPYLIRAQIHLSEGRVKAARHDAERARLLEPKVAERSYEIQALAYLASADPSRPIKVLEKAAKEGHLSADRTALLARLQMYSGRSQRALELYERALAGGSRFNHVKNDLAFLLAEQESELGRAEKLAELALEASGKQIDATDTLGYVYLKQGRPDAAYWKFRYAVDNTESPRAEYYYHLALALVALERRQEALAALASSLEIDPLFEPASQLNARLEAKEVGESS